MKNSVKKSIVVIYSIVINLVLITICYKMFNPLNLGINHIMANGLDISMFFSSNPLTNIFMFLSIFCLVTTNVYLIKSRKSTLQ